MATTSAERLATLEEQNRHHQQHIESIEVTLGEHGAILARMDKVLNGGLDLRIMAAIDTSFGKMAAKRDETRKRITIIASVTLGIAGIVSTILLKALS